MTTEKIDWYREVLELEPNSKVFLPLARLHLQIGQEDEAIAVLEHGLARHPEHLEARLLLVELLYRTGRQEACTRQVSELGRLFSTYAHFWQAWAVCLSATDGPPEVATALRLMAANFLHGPLSLQDLLNRGLDTVLREPDAATATPAEHAEHLSAAAASPAAGTVRCDDASPQGLFVPSPAASSLLDDVADVADMAGSTPAETPAPAPHDTDTPESAAPGNSRGPAPHSLLAAVLDAVDDRLDDDVLPAHMPLPRELGLSATEDTEDAPLPDAAAPLAGHDRAGQARDEGEVFRPEVSSLPFMAAPETSGEQADEQPSDEEGDEVFSLRTRSMADVLAEQGDLRGALDIYAELLAAAVNVHERVELQQRVDALMARLEGQSGQDESVAGSTAELSGKEKLITVLEALAERVEARAQN